MFRSQLQQATLLSGGVGEAATSAQSGYLPISLERTPLEAFSGIPIYARTRESGASDAGGRFTLYCAEHVAFADGHRARLLNHGLKFVYIPMAHQSRFRAQMESALQSVVNDPAMAVSVKCEIVYETSLELMNEILSDPHLAAQSGRIERVARAVTSLALSDTTAFSHLFAASHHDFYTATHMVNVGTWMVPLAYALGYRDHDELHHICEAGLLHDVGKMRVAANLLNKKGKLTDDEWAEIKLHPIYGVEYLQPYGGISEIIPIVVRQHHERMSGGGYPDNLRGDQIHRISRICAVVDVFDAMTAFRPFKEKTLTVAEAMAIIEKETPRDFDAEVVSAWSGLLRGAGQLPRKVAGGQGDAAGRGRRQAERFAINCPARLHVLRRQDGEWVEAPAVAAVAHNISRSGIGVLCPEPIDIGGYLRIYLLGRGSLDRTQEAIATHCRRYRDGWFEVGARFAHCTREHEGAPSNALAA